MPPWACGMMAFVPFTRQQFDELEATGFGVQDHHILALSSNKDTIVEALEAPRGTDGRSAPMGR